MICSFLIEFEFHYVGVAGFEPTTSSSRTTRATKLRYTPILLTVKIQSFAKKRGEILK